MTCIRRIPQRAAVMIVIGRVCRAAIPMQATPYSA